jgi:hypothetical protein
VSNEGGGASRSTDPAAGTSSATDVSLREYLNEKIESDRTLNRERFAFAAVIGGVIWFFIERHLGDLNHENARVAKVSENSVSSDTYLANEQQRKSEADKLDVRLAGYDEKFTKAISRDELTRETRGDRIASRDANSNQIRAIAAALTIALGLLTYATLHYRPAPVAPATTVTTTVTTP